MSKPRKLKRKAKKRMSRKEFNSRFYEMVRKQTPALLFCKADFYFNWCQPKDRKRLDSAAREILAAVLEKDQKDALVLFCFTADEIAVRNWTPMESPFAGCVKARLATGKTSPDWTTPR